MNKAQKLIECYLGEDTASAATALAAKHQGTLYNKQYDNIKFKFQYPTQASQFAFDAKDRFKVMIPPGNRSLAIVLL